MGPSLWTRFEAEMDREAATDCTWLWLDGLPEGLDDDGLEDALMGRAALAPTLAGALRAAGLAAWANRVDAMSRDDEGLQAVLGRALLFQAGLRFATSTTGEDLLTVAKAAFDRLRHTEHRPGQALAPFLAEDPGARSRLEAALDRRAHEVGTHPDRLAMHARRRELDPVKATTQNLWSSPYGQALALYPWAYEALRVDPEAYTRRLHALPIGVAHSSVGFAKDLELSELAALVRATPAAFCRTGVPVASGATYALLERVHVELGNSETSGGVPEVDVILDAVLSRPDAVWLARSWTQRLLWEVSHHAGVGAAAWPRRLFDALTERLVPWSANESLAWVRSEDMDLWQVDRVLVEVAILLNNDARPAAAELLSRAIKEGLVTDTGRERALNGGAFEANLVGLALGPADLAAWFKTLWEKTYAQRERCRIGPHQKIDPSARAALAWGLAGLNCAEEGHAAAWDEIFLALREVYLLDHSFTFIGETGGSIFRLAAALCTALVKRHAIPADRLESFVALVLEPTMNFAGYMAMIFEQDEALALTAARGLGRAGVRWALEKGLLNDEAARAKIRPEMLSRVEALAHRL